MKQPIEAVWSYNDHIHNIHCFRVVSVYQINFTKMYVVVDVSYDDIPQHQRQHHISHEELVRARYKLTYNNNSMGKPVRVS